MMGGLDGLLPEGMGTGTEARGGATPDGVGGFTTEVVSFLPLLPERMASVIGAHARHLRVTLPLLSKQPCPRHCRAVLHRGMGPPHQLQKLRVVLICVRPSGPPHLQMALSVLGTALIGAGGKGAGTGVDGAGGVGGGREAEDDDGAAGEGVAALRRSAERRGLGVAGAPGGLPCRMCHSLQCRLACCQRTSGSEHHHRSRAHPEGWQMQLPLPCKEC